VPGALARYWRTLTEPEPPDVAVEVRARSLGVVRVVRGRTGVVLGAAACLDLAPGVVKVSMTESNLLDPGAFKLTLRAALERSGVLGPARIALVLPDPVARVALVPASEVNVKGAGEVEEMIRFRLRRSIPFDIRQARVAHAGAPGPDGHLVAGVISRAVLDPYEEACRSLELEPGLVEPAGLALLGAAWEGGTGDWLLVNWDDGYLTIVVARGRAPILLRTLTGEGALTPEDVQREVASTAVYHRERLGSSELREAVLRCGVLPVGEAASLLEKPLGVRPQILDPLEALARGTATPASQSLAGAAASLLGVRP
jgi:hypothetical protein